VVDFTEKHLEIVKNPPSGYGKNMNPCIDCHSLMLQMAGQFLDLEKDDFLVTGEVLDQRPMSQNKDSLNRVANRCGYKTRVLRPLSARLLAPTEMELKGIVIRERLHAFHGRSRKEQIKLAAEYGLVRFPSPAGGCVLTDPGFSTKLNDLFEYNLRCGPGDIKQLFKGRHFRLNNGLKLIIARNSKECSALENELFNDEDILLVPETVPGPSAIIAGGMNVFLAGKSGTISPDMFRISPFKEALRVFSSYLRPNTEHLEVSFKKSGCSQKLCIPVYERFSLEYAKKFLIT
jgi:hypothetical protein